MPENRIRARSIHFLITGVIGLKVGHRPAVANLYRFKIKRPGRFAYSNTPGLGKPISYVGYPGFAPANQKYPMRLSGTAITDISPCRFTSIFTCTAIAGAGSKHGGGQSEDCDCENCFSHFPGYFKLIMKAWFPVDQVYQRNGYQRAGSEAYPLGICSAAKRKNNFQGTN